MEKSNGTVEKKMNDELRRKICYLSKYLSHNYELVRLKRNDDLYRMIVKNDAENFLITGDEVDDNWLFIKKVHRVFDSGLHPTDIRNLGDGYDF